MDTNMKFNTFAIGSNFLEAMGILGNEEVIPLVAQLEIQSAMNMDPDISGIDVDVEDGRIVKKYSKKEDFDIDIGEKIINSYLEEDKEVPEVAVHRNTLVLRYRKGAFN